LAAELQATGETEIEAGRLTGGVEYLLSASRIAGSSRVRETAVLSAVECLALAGDRRANGMREAVLACSDSARRSYVLALLLISAGHLAEAREALLEVIARPDYSHDRDLAGFVEASLAIACSFLTLGDEAVKWGSKRCR
jgi:hypothetical protein